MQEITYKTSLWGRTEMIQAETLLDAIYKARELFNESGADVSIATVLEKKEYATNNPNQAERTSHLINHKQ